MTMFQNLHRSMAPSDTLKIQCEACGRQTALSHAAARTACGPDASPADIRQRAKCKACGATGRARVWI